MKNLKKVSKLVFCFLFITTLFSCTIQKEVKIEVKKEEKEEVIATESNIEVDTKDNLVELTGDVMTLSSYELPKVGDVISGFKVKAIYDYDIKRAKVVLMEHEKTGASVLLVSNDDDDKQFNLGFNTLIDNDKGIPHVFEHSTLCGSEKYPGATVYDEILNRTYHTDMNAVTGQTCTYYYCGSLSDEQLFSIYKFDIDGVFKPNILTDKRILEREGYRYVLYDKNDDIDLAGIVYNEMAGSEGDINWISYFNAAKTLFPESYHSSYSFGHTDYIPDITMDELKEFHEKYYHPSNMIITLYGDIDYKKYLEYADSEYMSKYDRKEIDKTDSKYVQKSSFVEKNFDFPVTEKTVTDGGCVYKYAVSCEDLSAYEAGYFEPIFFALDNSDGPINRRLSERLPNANCEIQSIFYSEKPFFIVKISNVNETDGDVIKEIVEESFAELVENGIDSTVVEECIDRNILNKEFEKDSHGFQNYFDRILNFGFKEDGPAAFIKHQKGIEDVEKRYKDGSIDNLVKKYLSTNDNAVLVGTIPRAGSLEEKQNEKKEKLKKMKESMSDEEINLLIENSKGFDAWTEEQNNASNIDEVRAIRVASLSDVEQPYYVYEENVESVHILRSEIDDIKYNSYSMLFDTSGVKYDDILKLSLLSDLLGNISTENYSDLEWKAEMKRYSYSYNEGVDINYYFNGGYKPYFEFSVTCLDKYFDKTFELMKELMFNTKFEDVEKVRSIVSAKYSNMKEYANASPFEVANDISNAMTTTDKLYGLYTQEVGYLNFLQKIMNMSDDEISSLLTECKELLYSIYNKNGMTCKIIANFDTMKKIKEEVLSLSNKLKDEKIDSVDYTEKIGKEKKNVAVVISSNVQANWFSAPIFAEGIDFDARFRVMDRIVSDKILYPEFRLKRGCYGASATSGRYGVYCETTDDPDLKGTYEVYDNLPSLIDGVSVTEDELEDYKLKAYTRFSYPMTQFEASKTAIDEAFQKCDERMPVRYNRFMKDIKNMQVVDIASVSNAYKKVITNGTRATVGSEEEIEKNKDLFDEIVYDYVR